MKVHVLQLSYDDLEDPDDRLDRVVALLDQQKGADLLVLPELWFNGGFSYARWRETAQTLSGELVRRMQETARRIGAVVHMGSLVEHAGERDDGSPLLYNTSVLIDSDGKVLTTYRKIHRFGFSDGEPQLMEAGEGLSTSAVRFGDEEVVVGLATCYDLRFPELFRGLVDRGAELVLVPAAWPLSRVEHWSVLGQARAIEDQVFLVQCNTAGEHAGIAMGGSSSVIGPDGRRLRSAGHGEEALVVDLDLAAVRAARRAFPVLADRRLG